LGDCAPAEKLRNIWREPRPHAQTITAFRLATATLLPHRLDIRASNKMGTAAARNTGGPGHHFIQPGE
jgi:hypothetical protein